MMAMFTDEQMKIIMGMDNLSGEEDNIARQSLLADKMRGLGQNNRMDWGSQAARAIGGISGAIGDYYGAKQGYGLGDKRRKLLESLWGSGSGEGGGSPNNPTM